MKRALVFGAALALSFPAISLAAAPTASFIIEVGSPTGDSAVQLFICFSEAATGFTQGDLFVSNGSISALTTSTARPCSGSLYSFIVTASADPATILVELPPNTVQNSTLEFNTATSSVSWDYDSSLGASFTELSGRTWFDANHDGLRTSSGSCSSGGGDNCAPGVEADLHDVTVTATPYLADGSATDLSRGATSTLSNSSGGYFFYFGTVGVGRWHISQTLASGWTRTLPTTTESFYDVTINDTNNDGASVTRNNYVSATSYNFGSYDPNAVAAVTPLATPTTTPDAGTFSAAQMVMIGTASSSATTTSIRYTLGGATPACPSTGELFAGAVSVASSTTLRAIACSDASTSTVASFDFVINLPPGTPRAAPSSGDYGTSQDVTLTTSSSTANIYYTLDGGEPVCGASSLYAGIVHITLSATLQAVACGGGATSTPVEVIYTIAVSASSGSSDGGGGGGNGPPSDTAPANAKPPLQIREARVRETPSFLPRRPRRARCSGLRPLLPRKRIRRGKHPFHQKPPTRKNRRPHSEKCRPPPNSRKGGGASIR